LRSSGALEFLEKRKRLNASPAVLRERSCGGRLATFFRKTRDARGRGLLPLRTSPGPRPPLGKDALGRVGFWHMGKRTISVTTSAGLVEGECDPKFSSVLDTFVENFEKRDELGASACLSLEGRTVVDLWGGKMAEGGAPWTRDTVSIVFSATKGASAICAHMAADRGVLDLDAPVTRYWPGFGQAGKEDALVSMMLDHSVGLPHVRTKLKDGAFYDYNYMIETLEREAPFWKPGIRNGYHGVTSAWTVGEIVHRSTGKRLGEFFREEV